MRPFLKTQRIFCKINKEMSFPRFIILIFHISFPLVHFFLSSLGLWDLSSMRCTRSMRIGLRPNLAFSGCNPMSLVLHWWTFMTWPTKTRKGFGHDRFISYMGHNRIFMDISFLFLLGIFHPSTKKRQ